MPRRRSFFDDSQADVTLLADAYAAMKGLPEADPRSWMGQANLHAARCQAGPLNVHGGWWFLAWHRCYLFFHERILAKLSTSPATFALPYWDWTNSPNIPNTRALQSQGQPSPFFSPSSSLFDPNRLPVAGTTFGDDPFLTNIAINTGADSLAQIRANDFEDFCGSAPDDPNGRGAGEMEMGPHAAVHTWTGLELSPHHDMGNLSTAARDLLFVLHHANVERQFTLWLAAGPALPPPTSPWYGQWFNFWDEDGNPVSVTVQDALAHMGGNYLPPQQSFLLVNQPQEFRIGDQSRSVVGARLPEAMRVRIADAAPNPAAPAPAPREKVQIRIEGLDAPHDMPVILQVFLNKPDATLGDINGPNFVGTIHLLPGSLAHGERHRVRNVTLDVTRKAGLLHQDAGNQGPTVTLVPVKTQNPDANAPSPTVKFSKISLITKR